MTDESRPIFWSKVPRWELLFSETDMLAVWRAKARDALARNEKLLMNRGERYLARDSWCVPRATG